MIGRDLHDNNDFSPNFAGFADLMTALFLVFIIISAILLFQYKIKLKEISIIELEKINLSLQNKELRLKNSDLIVLNDTLKNKILLVNENLKNQPKRIIIPNELNNKVFFSTGQANIRKEFYYTLDIVANKIKFELENNNYNFIQIEGHTDKQPIYSANYSDNWDLGASRAIAVVRYFIKKGISAEQLSAVSHGEFKPVDDRNLEEAYSKNRRIEITLLKK